MKKLILFTFLSLFIISNVSAVDYKTSKTKKHKNDYSLLDDIDIDIEDGTLVVTPEDRDYPVIEITEDYKLYLNGDKVRMNKKEQELVENYYDEFILVIESAKKIGMEGAKIGVEGAAIGVAAVAGVFKLLSDEYDSDDLEDELEAKAEKLERKADRLETKAEYLEDRVNRFEHLHERLCEEISEIKELHVF